MKENDKTLLYQKYILQEENVFHAPYNPEMEFYNAVKNGDIKTVKKTLSTDFCKKEGLGSLSDNIIQSFKYHFSITVAILSRYCIDGGMPHEQAYTLSDMYIREVDKLTSLKDISSLHKIMVLDYTKKMQIIKTKTINSGTIIKCLDYIYNHLHERIKISELSEYLSISSSYLSHLFKKEMNISFSMYIRQKKIETAENMIKYSNYSDSQIASILAFPTQSYFILIFKKITGLTPGEYRNHQHQTLR